MAGLCKVTLKMKAVERSSCEPWSTPSETLVFPLPFLPPAIQLRHLLVETALGDAAAVFSLEDKSHLVRKAEVEDGRHQAS